MVDKWLKWLIIVGLEDMSQIQISSSPTLLPCLFLRKLLNFLLFSFCPFCRYLFYHVYVTRWSIFLFFWVVFFFFFVNEGNIFDWLIPYLCNDMHHIAETGILGICFMFNLEYCLPFLVLAEQTTAKLPKQNNHDKCQFFNQRGV